MRVAFGLLVLCIMLVSPGASRADQAADTDAAIEYLLNHVRDSDLVFIRNGKEHDPDEAYKHMQRKYKYFDKKIKTPEDFIEYSATKSTMSGKLYTMRLADGEELIARDYLLGLLAEYREEQ